MIPPGDVDRRPMRLPLVAIVIIMANTLMLLYRQYGLFLVSSQ